MFHPPGAILSLNYHLLISLLLFPYCSWKLQLKCESSMHYCNRDDKYWNTRKEARSKRHNGFWEKKKMPNGTHFHTKHLKPVPPFQSHWMHRYIRISCCFWILFYSMTVNGVWRDICCGWWHWAPAISFFKLWFLNARWIWPGFRSQWCNLK